MFRIVTAMAILLVAYGCWAQTRSKLPPNSVKLEWTVQQKTEGKVGNSYHVYSLTCIKGRCIMYIVTLNRCDEGERAAFFPRAEYWDNIPDEEGTSLLQVMFPKESVVELSLRGWDFGTAETKMRLGYRREVPGELIAVVTSFSGAVVKTSELLNKVISWELEAVTDPSGLKRVPLACNYVLVPTVATNAKK